MHRSSGRTAESMIGAIVLSVVFPFAAAAGAAIIGDRPSDFAFPEIPRTWDEGIPLGSGMTGALLWQKDTVLRMSLDRADLWDLRSIREFESPDFRFAWVVQQALSGDYRRVQEMGDIPYDRDAAPTKLPGAALEIPVPGIDQLASAVLRPGDATCVIRWKNGTTLETFVHATEHTGWFRFTGLRGTFEPRLIPPAYGSGGRSDNPANSGPGGNDLFRLGYPPPELSRKAGELLYRQKCRNGFEYTVRVAWKREGGDTITGMWDITPSRPYPLCIPAPRRGTGAGDHRAVSYAAAHASHAAWWSQFWSQSAVRLPDTTLEKQWYMEMYKFGSASRRGAPPITLQAVWTADNGKLPPWKGDFHHDLNTELSYWPAYSSNHLREETAFLDWLWWCKPVAERYTRRYFGTGGLNFPGVTTLTGEPMGGWIQYSLSPTLSAWLAQHFYLHWMYSRDRSFLRRRGYPWIREVAVYLESVSAKDSAGRRTIPLSSSPEINDNRVDAWFRSMTNYDVALVRWLFGAAEELALELGKSRDAAHWKMIRDEWPSLAVDTAGGGLLVAPGVPLKASHRHFSHLMAIHPLGLLDWDNGAADRTIISASLEHLRQLGPDWWCGYSWAWYGSMWARARDGERAAEALLTFARCFCAGNTFHVNGDQSGTGKSKFTYRPFTLEGNFAFAEGVQEMLMQSQHGRLRIFPAVPGAWKDIAFSHLRAEGALVVSSAMEGGRVTRVNIAAEQGGHVRLADPFGGENFTVHGAGIGAVTRENGLIEFTAVPGARVDLAAERRAGRDR